MNSNPILQLLQTGWRVTLGATTTAVETFQNPTLRSQRLGELQIVLQEKIQEWEAKGAITEQEARQLLEQLMNRSQTPPASTVERPPSSTPASPPPSSATEQNELEELTAQVAAMRAELERLRNSETGR